MKQLSPTLHEVITTTDKAQRDEMFSAYRVSGEANERQVVKFSGVQEKPEGGFESTYSVAYPFKVTEQNHGSNRNPRQFPGRKEAV